MTALSKVLRGVIKLLVVGANLTMDRTLRLPRLVPGAVQRPTTAIASAGGKSVNVCRAARAHGVRPRLVANLPGRMGAYAGDLLGGEGHDVRRVATEGELRSSIIIIEDDGRATVLNEPGPGLSATDRASLLAAVAEECAAEHAAFGALGVVVASGSLPPGAGSADLYAAVVRIAHAAGLRIVLDAARDALHLALADSPDVVVPNLSEALAVLGHGQATEAVEPDVADPLRAAADAATALTAMGARHALVTVGRHGVAGYTAGDPASGFTLSAPEVTEINPIGAGDSFAAGLACGLARGLDLRAAARLAVATGAASVASAVAGEVDPELVAALLRSVPDPAGSR